MANNSVPKTPKEVGVHVHDDAKRRLIPSAEHQPIISKSERLSIRVAYERRNRDLDPQLVWRGKDEQDESDLIVQAPPLYIQEKVHPKVLIEDLQNMTAADRKAQDEQFDLFADFNGHPPDADPTDFYQHDHNWSNRLILGDSLQVMASLSQREDLRGKVQCIYFDPPYGIKFNSNFQWSTTSRNVTDGNTKHITREPEQVKAFRDTWRDGIHSYLTYLRDRLVVARELLTESGSIFVQIGNENVHRVRALMDEVFGDENFVSEIIFRKTTSSTSTRLSSVNDIILWFGKSENTKFHRLFQAKGEDGGASAYKSSDDGEFTTSGLTSQNPGSRYPIHYMGKVFNANPGWWKTSEENMARVLRSGRLVTTSNSVRYKRFLADFPVYALDNLWDDTGGDTNKIYVVQTATEAVKRCILMATSPGDLVLDPTCGSGTTATVAEQWGRRWITIDTSRVALALARARIMGARYPSYFLSDSRDGQIKEAEITQIAPSSQPVLNNVRHGFVYERVPRITLKSIANNAEIDTIWERWQQILEPIRDDFNAALQENWEEWDIPREADDAWPDATKKLHFDWWSARIERQAEIDDSIAAKADTAFLYDKPYENKKKTRVAGPFTVESLSPHRTLAVDENDELIDPLDQADGAEKTSFAEMILDNLRVAGVQQAHKEDKINFTALKAWPGDLVCAEGRYLEGEGENAIEKRAAIFIGPEFGTVTRPDLVEAARESADAGFDVLITCAFNYEAHTTDFAKLGSVPVLKARINADLHMAADLKKTDKGNLFVVFGEPDIDILPQDDGQYRVKINGVDVFHPNSGQVRSDNADGIACWFIDTNYNNESFFVRHAYFLGANDPYKALKTTLKAEINAEAWETLNSDISRSFGAPESERIAVKVINHLGDEVMKVFKI